MIWLALLLTASTGAPLVASGDGQPPVTIIEIPIATTTVTTGSVDPPATSVAATTPPPSSTSPPETEDQGSPTVLWPVRWWIFGVVSVVWALFVLALVRGRLYMLPGDRAVSGIALPRRPPVVSSSALKSFEAVEYRIESGSSEIQPRTLGDFGTLEAAIDSARLARSRLLLSSGREAFWVVWNVHLKRAIWIAESGTPGENVIDLRTGRRQPYDAESAET